MQRSIAISGAASGLGRALAERLAAAGHRVIGVDRSGVQVEADLGAEAGRAAALRRIGELAEGRLDGLALAAAVGPHRPAQEVTRVNYFGVLALLDGLLPVLQQSNAAAALVVASVGAYFDESCDPALVEACLSGNEEAALQSCDALRLSGFMAYSSTKRALIRAIKSRAADWGARGVRLNALAPGNMETPMLESLYAHPQIGPAARALSVPLGHNAKPEQVAAVADFLLSPDANYIHGAALLADGGMMAAMRPDAHA